MIIFRLCSLNTTEEAFIGDTVILQDATNLPLYESDISTFPTDTAVTIPFDTVATSLLELFQTALSISILPLSITTCKTDVSSTRRIIELSLAQAESTVHMLNWAIRSVKFLGVEFD